MDANGDLYLSENQMAFFIAAYSGDNNLLAEAMARLTPDELNVKNENGDTALIIASEAGHLNCVTQLIAAGVDVNIQSFDGVGYTALMYAVENAHHAVVEALLIAKAKAELKALDGETAISLAQQSGNIAMIELFDKYAPLATKQAMFCSTVKYLFFRCLPYTCLGPFVLPEITEQTLSNRPRNA